MDPYKRFKLISNSLSVALVSVGVGLMTYASGPVDHLATSLFAANPQAPMSGLFATAFLIGLVVLVWLSLAHYVLPRVFGFTRVRKWLLGRYYFEGTWVEGVRLDDDRRAIAVLDFLPVEDRVLVTGRFINNEGEITANFRADFQDIQWPVVKLKHLQNRADEPGGSREGIAELMFEANQERPLRFDGCFIEGANQGARLEGFRLSERDAKRLRAPHERMELLGEYWAMFFDTDVRLGGRRSMRETVEASRQADAAR